MELSPQAVRTTGFKTVRKGYDPDEVDSFKERVASAVEQAQNQSAAMEARARAAVAKLQELTSAGAAKQATPASGVTTDTTGPAPQSTELSATDADNISRTLLLAQRTADTTVAAAKAEAEALTSAAQTDASGAREAAKAHAARMVADARDEARRASEHERVAAESEVQALLARRDFLVSDVDHLEQHIHSQRERLREAAASLHDIVERVPGGLGELRRPLLSASDTAGADRGPSSADHDDDAAARAVPGTAPDGDDTQAMAPADGEPGDSTDSSSFDAT